MKTTLKNDSAEWSNFIATNRAFEFIFARDYAFVVGLSRVTCGCLNAVAILAAVMCRAFIVALFRTAYFTQANQRVIVECTRRTGPHSSRLASQPINITPTSWQQVPYNWQQNKHKRAYCRRKIKTKLLICRNFCACGKSARRFRSISCLRLSASRCEVGFSKVLQQWVRDWLRSFTAHDTSQDMLQC